MKFPTLAAIGLLGLVAACGSEEEAHEEAPAVAESAPEATPETKAAAEPEPEAVKKDYDPVLLEPERANETAPAVYKARFDTTEGPFVIEVHRDWSPHGADRFYNLVKHGYYDDIAFFRAIEGFMVQFGIHGDPEIGAVWREAQIPDDEVKQSNKRGYVSFATAGPGTRTTQVFVNYNDKNAQLDDMGFSPFGQVVEGMDVVDKLYKGYGEGAPQGRGPSQGLLQKRGNAYLKEKFPELDYVKTATIVE